MSFLIKDDKVRGKHEQIWDVIKNKLGIKFHSEPIYEKKYLKAKVTEFDIVLKANFLENDVPKENMHYTCTACITIVSVMRIDKKNHSQVYLEECKYRIKKTQMSRFINIIIRFRVIRFRFKFRKNRVKSWCWINGKIRIWSWYWIRHFTHTFCWLWTSLYAYIFKGTIL